MTHIRAIDGCDIEFVRREPAYPGCKVIYRWRGRLWRCSEREWKRYTEKKNANA